MYIRRCIFAFEKLKKLLKEITNEDVPEMLKKLFSLR